MGHLGGSHQGGAAGRQRDFAETFCRAVATERRLATLLRQSDPANDLDFTDLVKSHRSESMLVAHLAGRLRLTARSTRDRETSKAAVKGPRPWEDAGLS
jgi:hypothetical protein